MIHACYLTVFEQPQEELEQALYNLLDDLGAEYESVRLNPLTTNQCQLQAAVTLNFEFELNIHWQLDINPPILVTFDVEMAVAIEPVQLQNALTKPAEIYFPKLTLIYNFYGDERSKRLFPLVMNFENAVREFIISVMLKKYGSGWEDIIDNYIEDAEKNSNIYKINDRWKEKLKNFKQLKKDAVDKQKNDYPKYNPLIMHWLYYANLIDLLNIIEIVDYLQGCKKPVSVSQLPFASVVGKEKRDTIMKNISQLNGLRNKLMHGRYLTVEDENSIQSSCEKLHDLIIQQGHINNKVIRNLIKY